MSASKDLDSLQMVHVSLFAEMDSSFTLNNVTMEIQKAVTAAINAKLSPSSDARTEVKPHLPDVAILERLPSHTNGQTK